MTSRGTQRDLASGRWRSLSLRFSTLCCWGGFPLITGAQQSTFQQDPVDHYGSRVLAIVIVLGITLVLFSLFRYRGGRAGPPSWGLLIGGAAGVPLIFFGVGDF